MASAPPASRARPRAVGRRRALSRIGVNIALDALAAAVAAPLAQWLTAPDRPPLPVWAVAWGAVALLIAGTPFRLPLQYWRFAGAGELLAVAASSVLAAGLFALGLDVADVRLPAPGFPVVQALCLLVLLGLPRMGYRMMREHPGTGGDGSAGPSPRPVLLVGAGEGADLFLRALSAEPRAPYRAVGLLSHGQAQTGRRIQNCPILGSIDETGAILEGLRQQGALPEVLVVTDPNLSGTPLAGLLAAADAAGLRVARPPRPTALDQGVSGDPSSSTRFGGAGFDLRPVAIEELLGRPLVPLDRAGMARLVQGQRVLVTGAGGTIGSELARQVAALGPSLLALLDNGEYALWQIDLELAEAHPTMSRRTLIADVRDPGRLHAICGELRPALVFHAAALKHVPMVEANPLEGLLTNACGTRHVADAAIACGAAAMVMISTDKAVNPSSVMGASKRLAEMYCQGLNAAAGRRPGSSTACLTVRFGNVLGSTGSVVPLFQRQLARGGPLTVTHPDMERYFMTVREAVGLVLQASVAGAREHTSDGIFVLDMGEPVRILDLARQIIRLAGLRPELDIPIAFTGLRPGEKLAEELFHDREPPLPTGTPGLLMARPRTADPAIVGRALDEIATASRAGQVDAALAVLARMVPEFTHDTDAAARA